MPEQSAAEQAVELNEDVEVEHDQYLIFVVESQEFGIQAMRIQEISTMVTATKIPYAPGHIEGIMNLRGRLASVINFHRMFGFKPKEHDEDTRIVMVEYNSFPVGIIVDAVEEVIRIPDDRVHPLPEATSKVVAEEFIRGVGMLNERLIILLNIDKVMSKAELVDADLMRQTIESVEGERALAEVESEEVAVPAAKPERKPVRRRAR